MAAAYRPWRTFERTLLDRFVLIAGILTVVQLVPLPGRVIDAVSPQARAAWGQLSLTVGDALPMSVDLASGAWAAAIAFAAIVVFFTCRSLFEAGGVRIVVRGIAATGLILSAIGLAQDATSHGLIYWVWRPLQEGAPPFGPFVDRNHFATWVVLVVPLAAGYLSAHVAAHQAGGERTQPWRRRIVLLLDGRALWLTSALALMVVALAATLSRSGLFGLAVAVAVSAAARLAHGRGRPHQVSWIALAVAAGLGVVVARTDPAAIYHRLGTAGVSAAGRLEIWRATLPVIRDFWLTGTGAGTYETAMLVYQRTAGAGRYNQAHNQYLQLAAEGGLLLTVPVCIALVSFARRTWSAVMSDHSGMYWIRAGAAAGLAGVAAQSLFETGLTTPANIFLAATCAAIAIHAPSAAQHQPH